MAPQTAWILIKITLPFLFVRSSTLARRGSLPRSWHRPKRGATETPRKEEQKKQRRKKNKTTRVGDGQSERASHPANPFFYLSLPFSLSLSLIPSLFPFLSRVSTFPPIFPLRGYSAKRRQRSEGGRTEAGRGETSG